MTVPARNTYPHTLVKLLLHMICNNDVAVHSVRRLLRLQLRNMRARALCILGRSDDLRVYHCVCEYRRMCGASASCSKY